MPAMLRRLKRWGARGSHFGIVALFTLFAAFPFYWMLVTTFKRTSDLMNTKNNPFLFNQPAPSVGRGYRPPGPTGGG